MMLDADPALRSLVNMLRWSDKHIARARDGEFNPIKSRTNLTLQAG
jgi:hypothetical protein